MGSLHAVFDGGVLKPEMPVYPEVGRRYALIVKRTAETKPPREESAYPLTRILELATDMGVDDLSTRHDWYAHGGGKSETCQICLLRYCLCQCTHQYPRPVA
jgi:hypothetical protein